MLPMLSKIVGTPTRVVCDQVPRSVIVLEDKHILVECNEHQTSTHGGGNSRSQHLLVGDTVRFDNEDSLT